MSKIILVLVGSFLFLNFVNPVSADEFDGEDEDMGHVVSWIPNFLIVFI